MRASMGFGAMLVWGVAACGKGGADGVADGVGEREAGHVHGHEHGHEHLHDSVHGHEHGPGIGDAGVRGPSNPYVYEPIDAQGEARPEPTGPAAGPMEFSGVTFEVVIEGKKEVLSLSDEVLAKRPGPIATWDCNPQYGIVNFVDFAIAEDPARKGATFVIRVDAAKPEAMRAGTPTDARLSIRRVGEAGLTTARGVATWEPGYGGGRAVAEVGLDFGLEVRWRCAEKVGAP